jgi:prepilin-type N-terminal cleavage/methylation domain-containing protein
MRSKSKGFTYVELMLVMAIAAILLTVTLLVYNPLEGRARARDNKRINDIFVLERIITEYHLDTGGYPDAPDTLRNSHELPSASTISPDNSQSGWIEQDLRNYSTFLPLDPINDANYHYSYVHNGETYELNVKMELAVSEMSNDGGDDTGTYEVGTNLSLISP